MAAAESAAGLNIIDHDKGPAILATSITVTALSTLFVAARLFTRARIIGKLYLDDYFISISMICSWVTVGITAKAVSYGSGRHAALLTEYQFSHAILWTMVAFLPGILSFAVPKLAVVALLTRMMNPSRTHAVIMWTVAIVCLISLMGCVGILFGQCTPTHSTWTFSVKGECWSPMILVNYSIYAGSFSAFTDLYFAVYPAIVLCGLQLNIRKKIALSCALGIGSVATIVAIYKTTRIPGLASPDFVYDTADLTIWTAIEGSTLMIASSIPILKPLMDLVFGRRAFSSNDSNERYEKYDRSRSGKDESGVELSKRSRKRGRPMDTAISQLETAVDSTSYEEHRKSADQDSQTNIVSSTSEPPASVPATPPLGAIRRTDRVTVTTSYGEDPERGLPMSRWG
ncbi:uncharacterized protein B0H64DRAFT_377928 [Chaetomium fimeti]|uniref:Rhodopsin domain-containing protein n=1 Tax=Chaetomium fimeti TaxID=1854472 RepID=A0AAE0LMS5_9PEZI|nr:hypothetical protein B0H64DRAFT_377928 [Chaetomium fimeti]